MSRARSGESAWAVIATMLLCATGSALTCVCSEIRALAQPELLLDALSATLRDVTSRAAVSTSRVGSLDSRIRGRPLSACLSLLAGMTSRSASALYFSVATTR